MDKDELIDIWREVVLKNTTNGSCNFQQAAIDFAELVAKPWVETNKALANEIIELQKQAEQEPVAWCSMFGEYAHIEWGSKRTDNAIHTIPLYAAPVRTKDLTDSEIRAMFNGYVAPEILLMFRAIIAADRRKNETFPNTPTP